MEIGRAEDDADDAGQRGWIVWRDLFSDSPGVVQPRQVDRDELPAAATQLVQRLYEQFLSDAALSLDQHRAAGRRDLENLVSDGHLSALIHSGARVHQAGCNGCIGMGQAPATDKISLRTVPRNFPARSGTVEDKVCLVSPETAAALYRKT